MKWTLPEVLRNNAYVPIFNLPLVESVVRYVGSSPLSLSSKLHLHLYSYLSDQILFISH